MAASPRAERARTVWPGPASGAASGGGGRIEAQCRVVAVRADLVVSCGAKEPGSAGLSAG